METHDEIMELLGAYALDAVDEDERLAVETHLPECPRCAAEVADHREVAAMLAHTGGDAPEGVWTKIVDSLEETPPAFRMPGARTPSGEAAVEDAETTDELASRRERRSRRPVVVAAVAAAAVALVVGLVGGTLLTADGGGERPEVAAASLPEVAREVLNDPESAKVTLESPEGEPLEVTAAIEPDGSGYLLGTSLPALEPGQTYQLWGEHGGTVMSLGVLGQSPEVVAFHADPGTETLMITREDAPGVAISENPAVLVGNVS